MPEPRGDSRPDSARSRAGGWRALWLVPFAVFALMLWSEAEVPALPDLQQGPDLWRALGNPQVGVGLEGLFSSQAARDTGARLFVTLLFFGLAWMAARFCPGPIRAFAAACARRVEGMTKRGFATSLFAAGVALPLSWFAFVRGLTPRLGDEIAYLFQSRMFAGGFLTTHAPVRPRFFHVHLVVRGGRWFSQYPPGHPLVQAPGWWIHAPWIIGPLAGAIAVLAIWRITARLYDERTGRIAGLLMLASPFYIYQSGSYLSHSTCLMLGTLAAWGLLVAVQALGRPIASEAAPARPVPIVPETLFARILRLLRASPLLAAVSGACLGLAAAARPLTGIGLAAGIGLMGVIAAATALRSGGGLSRRRLARAALVFALFGAGTLSTALIAPVYNSRTTGKPLRWGYELAQTSSHALGFGKRGDLGIDFTPQRALFNTRLRWRWLDGGTLVGDDPIPGSGFFYWPFPFLIIPLGLLAGRARRNDLLLAAVPLCLAAAYFPYYYLDMCWGPRFLYEASFALVPLTARGALAWSAILPGFPAPGGRRVTGGAIVAALLAIAVACGAGHALLIGEKLYDPVTWPTRRVDQAFEEAVRGAGVGRDVVFVRNAGAWYETVWRRMFVDRDLSVMYVKDLGEENGNLMEKVNRKTAWMAVFNGDPKHPQFDVAPYVPPPPVPAPESGARAKGAPGEVPPGEAARPADTAPPMELP